MREASAVVIVALERDDALRLWTDLGRWATFVEGFARTLDVSGDWPAEGAKVVWESNPGGRGRVTEKVIEHSAPPEGRARFRTEVYEERLLGLQTVVFQPPLAGDTTNVELHLEYELAGRVGPARRLADVLFIRRALRDSLRRTLGRFAVEAEEKAGLR